MTDQLLALARLEPVLVILEDVHWIDPTTLELIEQSLGVIGSARVLLLLTSRPEGERRLSGTTAIARLKVKRLARAGVEAILTRLGGDAGLSEATIDAIVTRTDGIPLFAEELTKTILQTGQAVVPASLHDSLMARLDRLPQAKEVIRIAACIGRDFDYPLLAAVAERSGASLAAALGQLSDAELVGCLGDRPDAGYRFSHTLVRDAAYGSLLKSRRRDLHGRIAVALEAQSAREFATDPAELARHHVAADAPDRALEPLRRAAERAVLVGATTEAIAHYRQALDLLD